jgi:hypothetical protein
MISRKIILGAGTDCASSDTLWFGNLTCRTGMDTSAYAQMGQLHHCFRSPSPISVLAVSLGGRSSVSNVFITASFAVAGRVCVEHQVCAGTSVLQLAESIG